MFKQYKTISRVTCFFKHYPGLFVFFFSFGQRHPKRVPVAIEAPGLGMLTGAVPTLSNN